MTIRNKTLVLCLCLASLVASGCNFDDILLVGLDEKDNPAEAVLSRKDYADKVGKALATVQESSVPVLESRNASSGFMLRTLVIGIGVSAEAGIGPFKVGAVPRFRVAFTNSSDPSLP